MSLDRQALRKHLRSQRQQLTESEQALAAEQVTQTFLSALASNLPKQANLALYLTNDGEISPSEICKWCWANDINVFLPVLDGQALVFARYTSDCEWQKNSFGILEPIDPNPATGSDMDQVLMPLVGFDAQGGRLGMGGGFYDRTFEHKAERTQLIGLAHDCQEVESLPIESWDVPLGGILTPSRFIPC
ncbi:5-formyltetrahydrofolate cyclo-ligase [Marinomonas ostreistagni]|uniref:5-formyltetrahydrofolate cyclo-ligase n=1 Tax=Marinomonas ostreistagni TaxID=359209 RepID=UPI0019503AF8|nr:5-formyltetrahydrofolate cyclo-ligase [Marinomonas ostreistagni]MBM6551579.1 5-formyltetrahydrofolate cyclo-ligase [Marinomonas ostreistagni]